MLQNAKISEFLDIQDVELSVNEAIPLGLIINELLTNTYKYAFPAHQQEKKVIIRFLKKQTDFILRVSDNGTGFPDHFNPDDSGSLGYQIINGLVQQLKGTITIEKDSAAVTVIFPEKTMNKPVSSGY
jgi:two-component sensor histidine kinase